MQPVSSSCLQVTYQGIKNFSVSKTSIVAWIGIIILTLGITLRSYNYYGTFATYAQVGFGITCIIGSTLAHVCIQHCKKITEATFERSRILPSSSSIDQVRAADFDPEFVDKYGRSSLHLACILHREDKASKLIRNHPETLHSRDDFENLPLHVSVSCNDDEIAESILKAAPELCKATNKKQETPLHLAAKNVVPQYLRIVDMLIERGAELEARDSLGNTPLQNATLRKDEHAEQIFDHIHSKGALINNINIADNTFLHTFLSKREKESDEALHFFKSLIKLGLNIEAKGEGGLRPLHLAIKYRLIGCARVLLERNPPAEVNARDNEGKTPLHYALDNLEMVTLLCSKEADLNAKDYNGDTILHLLARYYYKYIPRFSSSAMREDITYLFFETLDYLLTQGVDKSAMNYKGHTALEDIKQSPFLESDLYQLLLQKLE